MNPPTLNCQLGDELFVLAGTVSSPLVEATPLVGGGYPGYHPGAFRLRFADGRLLKGRRFGSTSRAATVEYVSQHVQHPGFPQVLIRSGSALLTEWVEGQAFNSADCTPEVLRQCGAVHGFMHSVQVPGECPYFPRDTIQEWHARLERNLAALVETQVLEENEALHAFALAARHAPNSYAVGFVHRDFCAENLLLRPSGAICAVDNETLAVDPYDYDLGRTWYRWPMDPWQREAYLDGYQCHRSAKDFLAHLPYWGMMAVVGAAVFRLEKQTSAVSVPVRRLRALLRDLEQGVAAEELALRS